MASKAPEKKRFVEALSIYLENSRGVGRNTQATTPTAKANKTMTTRKQLLGDKGTTGAGIQSIKKAGTARTNSTKK